MVYHLPNGCTRRSCINPHEQLHPIDCFRSQFLESRQNLIQKWWENQASKTSTFHGIRCSPLFILPPLTKLSSQVLEWGLQKLQKENEKNHDIYLELIHLCGKIQNTQTAMRVFTLMENQGLKPTSIILNALISAHLSSVRLWWHGMKPKWPSGFQLI
ncbi:unnamed protein product [Lactuca virosa]|uniref:Pentatricopeptide repeat-containing protein n=1 Tax=Lactuca virosa TaxID=75947 RepID=A0AAU9PMJ2_9ASTR|nr:unnamed protein product [Lactuca virosa]